MAATSTALTGPQKAAILILSLPEEVSRDMLVCLDRREIDRILEAMSAIGEVTHEMQATVLDEFRSRTAPSQKRIAGGTHRALDVIETLVPADHAEVLKAKYERDSAPIAFTLASHAPSFIASVIAPEDAQTIALILAQLPARRGAQVISSLPEEIRSDVVLRLANLGPVSAEVIAEVAAALQVVFSQREDAVAGRGGTEIVAELINRMRPEESDAILDGIQSADEATAAEIRNALLTFDQLVSIEDRGFKKLLQQVPMEDLVLALKACSDEIRDKVYKNLSRRAGEALREEEETQPPRRLSEVEAKQREIVAEARKLAENGELSIGITESDEAFV